MKLAKNGFIQKFCSPNALLTFSEYLQDYGSEQTCKAGQAFIQKEVETSPEAGRKLLAERLARIEQGERDLYF